MIVLQFSYRKSENKHPFGPFDDVKVITWPHILGFIGHTDWSGLSVHGLKWNSPEETYMQLWAGEQVCSDRLRDGVFPPPSAPEASESEQVAVGLGQAGQVFGDMAWGAEPVRTKPVPWCSQCGQTFHPTASFLSVGLGRPPAEALSAFPAFISLCRFLESATGADF